MVEGTISNGKLKKKVTFSTKIPKRKDDPIPTKTYNGSKSFWPLSLRSQLFLPYFDTKPKHGLTAFDSNDDVRILGKGHFGTVFVHNTTNQDNNNQMAVKVLKKSLIIRENAIVQIIQEIRIHSVCSGLPNVLPFLGAWQDQCNLYVSSRLCTNGNLAGLMNSRKSKPISSPAVKMAAYQIHSGLQAIHNLGVIFRDIKLKNILISESGDLAISDFGLAKWLNRHQRTYTICGTLAFMAPEVALGQPYQHSVDLWSLGMVLFCLAFGRLPYPNAKDHDQLAELQKDVEAIKISHEESEIEELIRNLLQWDENQRNFQLKDEASFLDPFRKGPSFLQTLTENIEK